jgi:hypothetical protein
MFGALVVVVTLYYCVRRCIEKPYGKVQKEEAISP